MPLLETRKLDVFYGGFQALFGIDITVDTGEVVAIVGANGAGKSTLLKALAGLVAGPAESIRFDRRDIGGLPAFDVVRLGIALVPEGRRLFPSLSVEEDLIVGAYRNKATPRWSLDAIYQLFPPLRARRAQPSTTLSGGEQQMVAIGRALASDPRVLLCDEISLGLSPRVVGDVYRALTEIRRNGTTILVVEQDLSAALAAADRVYCLREGRVSLHGRPADLSHEVIHAAYFGH
jgi:branched-chain amino acid transport system ATP-binding protein